MIIWGESHSFTLLVETAEKQVARMRGRLRVTVIIQNISTRNVAIGQSESSILY